LFLATFSENDMTVSESAHIQPAGEAAESVLVAMTNLPDEASAARLARAVLAARVAACVNRLAPCQSEYWWQGKLEQAQEWPLLIKTTRVQYAALEAVIRAEHPYDVPELVAWPVGAGFAPYLAWVREEASGMPTGDANAPR
jgi:periplasmic divalent cation tolerance protein